MAEETPMRPLLLDPSKVTALSSIQQSHSTQQHPAKSQHSAVFSKVTALSSIKQSHSTEQYPKDDSTEQYPAKLQH